jgi:hypothetical protein
VASSEIGPPSDSRPLVLASDLEREHVAALLNQACVEGRLSLDDFSTRIGRSLVARTRSELEDITRDMPPPGPTATAGPPKRRLRAILSGISRRGEWRVDPHTEVVAVLGNCTLDLRRATITSPITTISAFCVLGSVAVIVPEGVHVEMEGDSVLSDIGVRLTGRAPEPGAPVIRLAVRCFLGNVTATDRPSLGTQISEQVSAWVRAGTGRPPQGPP